MSKWEDAGRALERELESMTKEELQDALVEAREYERIFDKFHTCIMEAVKAKNNGEMVFPKKWIERLNYPEIGGEFNELQWELICWLKEELSNAIRAFGYTKEEDNVFSFPFGRKADAGNGIICEKYLAFEGKKYCKGDVITVSVKKSPENVVVSGKLESVADYLLEPEIKLVQADDTAVSVKVAEILQIDII